jgi:hypothetical protein
LVCEAFLNYLTDFQEDFGNKPAFVQKRWLIFHQAQASTMNQKELYGIAKALLLAGGVVAIVLGGLDLLALAARGTYGLGMVRSLVGVAVGVVALATMSQTRSEAIDLVLIVLGLISGNAGGLLIALAGIIGLVARYVSLGPAQPAIPAPTTST